MKGRLCLCVMDIMLKEFMFGFALEHLCAITGTGRERKPPHLPPRSQVMWG